MQRSLLSAFIVALLVCFGASHAVAAQKLKFSDIPQVDSAAFYKALSAEKGKLVVVSVFATWCPPCKEEIVGLVNIRNAYPQDKVSMIGVCVDTPHPKPEKLMTYIEDRQMNYPVMLAKGNFIDELRIDKDRRGVTSVPLLLIYNADGTLVFSHEGLMVDENGRRDEKKLAATIDKFLVR